MTLRPTIAREAAHLLGGGVVAAATETLFGLLADPSQPGALNRLFSLKPRGADKGVPLIVPGLEAWESLVAEVPPLARALAERFWPGPLTIVLPARSGLDPRLLVGDTVAVRWPAESSALALAEATSRPLTATSANLPGEPPASCSAEVGRAFERAVREGDLLIVQGHSPASRPSTIVAVSSQGATVLRGGAIAATDIEHTLKGALC